MAQVLDAAAAPTSASSTATLPVFATGKYTTRAITVEKGSGPSSPPKPLLIVTPTLEGTYPVMLFFHGFCLCNSFYSHLLNHISSHGFIVVAPQMVESLKTRLLNSFRKLYSSNNVPSGIEEVNYAGQVTDWLSSGLQSVLPPDVGPNLEKLALAGHSRGGKTAFALALGLSKPAPKLNFSLLLGIDPVAGICKDCRTEPKILTYKPRSFNLSIPVTVVGTGLGEEKRNCCSPACAPDGVNHKEFFNECKPPCYHFVAKDYGHMDMLDDNPPGLVGVLADCLCKNGKGAKELMRSGVGGIAVAFLNAYLEGQDGDLKAIVDQPDLAPIKLDPVEVVLE